MNNLKSLIEKSWSENDQERLQALKEINACNGIFCILVRESDNFYYDVVRIFNSNGDYIGAVCPNVNNERILEVSNSETLYRTNNEFYTKLSKIQGKDCTLYFVEENANPDSDGVYLQEVIYVDTSFIKTLKFLSTYCDDSSVELFKKLKARY
jgi:hypothetical protein